jgi:hypothetical protein
MAFNPLFLVIGVTLLGIIITAVILGIVNTISGNLEATDVRRLTGNCIESKDSVADLLDTDLVRMRWINGIALAVFILLFILSIVGIFFTGVKGTKNGANTSVSTSTVTSIFTSSLFVFGILGLLFFVFLAYTILYGIMLTKINSVEPECFKGDKADSKSDAALFNSSKNLITTQFIICIVMLFITAIVIGGAIFVKVRKSN